MLEDPASLHVPSALHPGLFSRLKCHTVSLFYFLEDRSIPQLHWSSIAFTMSTSSASSERPRLSPQESVEAYTTSTALGPYNVRHAHYMGLSGSALRTAIGLTAGLAFLAFGYGQGTLVTIRTLSIEASSSLSYQVTSVESCFCTIGVRPSHASMPCRTPTSRLLL